MSEQGHDIAVVIETLLFASDKPMSIKALARLTETPVKEVEKVLAHLATRWQDRGLMLHEVASGWRFQTKPAFRKEIEKLDNVKPPKYSRAVMECLAIIAYRQPVTRGDIEHIRGVPVASSTVKTLEERGWIEAIGHRETPGRPQLFATTKQFLDDLGVSSLDALPYTETLSEDLFAQIPPVSSTN